MLFITTGVNLIHPLVSSKDVNSSVCGIFFLKTPQFYHKSTIRRVESIARSESTLSNKASLKPYLEKLVRRQNLTESEIHSALDLVLDGNSPEQLAAFLVLLASKTETPLEIGAIAESMRSRMVSVNPKCAREHNEPLIDIVGTGGDGADTINISTAASIVVASCGARVAKHGNRSVSSKCGSADVLEELGICLDLDAHGVERCVDNAGIGFMFAPRFHPAMKSVAAVRKALGIRTVFNIMGPLLNPARTQRAVIGVYSAEYCSIMAQALKNLGAEHILVVNTDGIDEFSPTGVAHVAELLPDGSIKEYSFDPESVGIARCVIEDLRGGDAQVNAALLEEILSGNRNGPMEDAIVLNAAVGLYVAGKCKSIQEGVITAQNSIRNGNPMHTLKKWAKESNA